MKPKNNIIIISGPTATGKTKTSIELARTFQAEVLNFDSLLFYKEISIGTAKPSEAEKENISHHLIGDQSIFSPINAADFVELALPIILDIHKRDKNVILVGGSGFYLQALLYGMYDSPHTSEKILDKSEELYLKEGIGPFRDILKVNDPKSYERYHENDHYRIRRAVEYFWQTSKMFSKAREKMSKKREVGLSNEKKYNWRIFHAHLDIDKETHFKIIQKRCKEMLQAGLIEEVRNLLNTGANGSEKPLLSIGYKETIAYIHDEFDSYEAYYERLCINTRRLAKAQRTWFKKVEKNCYNPLTDKDILMRDITNFLTK